MAATLKGTIRGLINALQTALKDKSLPKATREHIDALDGDLKKNWKDLETDPEDQADQGTDENVEEAAGMSFNQVENLLQGALQSQYKDSWVYVRELFDDSIYSVSAKGDGMAAPEPAKMYQAPYVIGPDGKATFGDAVEVVQKTVYCPVGESVRFKEVVNPISEPSPLPSPLKGEGVREVQNDPKVGGGVDRDKLPAEDFAGKDRSFPIVKPGDVSDAAASIGRAGKGNYSSDQLKANIIKIAKRKGKAYVEQLPKDWQGSSDTKESADGVVELSGDYVPLVESIELKEFTPLNEDSGR